MMLGLGVGAYTAGFFHLYNHAFFKALLFLCAGSIIHAMGSYNLFEMGGLRSRMPLTFWTMVVAGLSLSRSEEHTSELQSRQYLVCRLLLEKKKTSQNPVRPLRRPLPPVTR